MSAYSDFVSSKRRAHIAAGIDCPPLHESLFPHQVDIVQWAARMGRAAIFADTGLGKTRMQAEWARVVVQSTDKPVLILAPLAVGEQTIAEARSIGIDCGKVGGGHDVEVVNYDRLHTLDSTAYGGVVLDESSILKNYSGATRTALIDAFRGTPYRLACTATPAPNDHTELGNHAEFLGVCTYQEMLAEFFVHDSSSSTARGWRLKGHALADFWKWVASWAVVVRLPSDLGHDDAGYLLPPLDLRSDVVEYDATSHREDGALFAVPATGLAEQRAVRKGSVDERVAHVKALVDAEPDEQWLIWCHLNAESEAIRKALGAVEVKGADKSEVKADRLLGFSRGEVRVMVTKPSIAGFGMNWQNCRRMAFVGVSHSYEMFYQAVRRCWRFGQTSPVRVHLVQTAMDGAVASNLRRKADNADAMAASMLALVREHQIESVTGRRPGTPPKAETTTTKPEWLNTETPCLA